MYYLVPPNVIYVVFVSPLLNCNHFHSNHLDKFNTLLTSQLTLSDFRPFSVKTHSLKIKNPRTLNLSSESMATSSSNQGTSMQVATGDAYQIKGRTMKLEGWQLIVQVESPVDFLSLAHHGCELRNYFHAQDLDGYFYMLSGPTYDNLIKYFWVRAEVFDLYAAEMEEHEKVLIDYSLEGKTREQLGLKPFTCTEIRSNIMGIPVTITEEIIARAIRRADDHMKRAWTTQVHGMMWGT